MYTNLIRLIEIFLNKHDYWHITIILHNLPVLEAGNAFDELIAIAQICKPHKDYIGKAYNQYLEKIKDQMSKYRDTIEINEVFKRAKL